MRVQLILWGLLVATVGESSNYTHITKLAGNRNRNTNEIIEIDSINNISSATDLDDKLRYDIKTATYDKNPDNEDGRDKKIEGSTEVEKHRSVKNGLDDLNIKEYHKNDKFINNNHTTNNHTLDHKFNNFDKDANNSGNNNNNKILRLTKSHHNNNKNLTSTLIALNNSVIMLPRHQKVIADIVEKKGLLPAMNGEHILKRGKRYLQFAKGSRVSWRTTGKNNILKVNTLWGYGYGFRANFPFPGPEETRRPFFKRDVLHSLADILDGHGLDGKACILKSYCTAALDVDSNIGGGMLFKMLKLIFTLHENEKRHFPYLRLENCQQILHSHCPLSFDSISPYTDDV